MLKETKKKDLPINQSIKAEKVMFRYTKTTLKRKNQNRYLKREKKHW